MVEGFCDHGGASAHEGFQSWRKKHELGYFLSFKTQSRCLLHRSLCRHPGDYEWTIEDHRAWGSLTRRRKACSTNLVELLSWAEREGIMYRPCRHCDLEPLPKTRTSKIRYHDHEFLRLAEELPHGTLFPEGGRKTITINAYERSYAARNVCLAHHGVSCKVCGFDFQLSYGELGRGFIHVHHILPVSQVKKRYKVNPITDLMPVCPNCHEMLHRTTPPIQIKDLMTIFKRAHSAR